MIPPCLSVCLSACAVSAEWLDNTQYVQNSHDQHSHVIMSASSKFAMHNLCLVLLLSLLYHIMPSQTDWQGITEDVIGLISLADTLQTEEELESLLEDESEESDSDDELIKGDLVEDLMDYLELIHSKRYLREREPIEKSTNNFILHFYIYCNTQPQMF